MLLSVRARAMKASTKANLPHTVSAIATDILITIGEVSPPDGVTRNDVLGTLSCNLRVLANALAEEREGATFNGIRPSEAVKQLLGKLERI